MPSDHRSVSSSRMVAGAAAPPDDFGNTPAASTVVALGATVNGKIETVGDRDMFKLQLTAGKLYSFAMQGLDDSGRIKNMSMTFSDASGTVYDSVTVGPTNGYSFIPTVSGSYYVGANGSTDGTGVLSYTFKASEAVDDFGSTTATAGRLDVDGKVAGGLLDAGGGDHDWFAVSLVAGTGYWFSLQGGTLSGGPTGLARLAVFDAAGKEVVQDSGEHNYLNNAPVLPFVAPTTGTYYLDVSAVRNSSVPGGGTYSVQAQVAAADEAGGDMAHAAPLALDSPVHGRVAVATDKDVYKVGLTAGTSYVLQRDGFVFKGTVFPFDTVLTDSAGHVVTQVTPGGTSDGIYVVYNIAASGDYYLTVSSPVTPADFSSVYTLKLSAAATDDYAATNQTTGLLDVAQPVHGTIELPQDVDRVRAHLEAGQKYVFDLQADSLNLVWDGGLTLKDERGVNVGSAVIQNGLGHDLRIAYTAVSTGDYYLEMRGNSSLNGGDYTLSEHLLTGDTTAPVLQSASIASGATGVSATGAITFAFDDLVVMTGDWALTNSRGQAFHDLLVRIADNKVVITSRLPLDPGMTYTLTLGDIKDLAGNAYTGPKVYTFSTAAAAADDYAASIATTGVLAVGTPVAANFESTSDIDWFKFHASGGKDYSFEGGFYYSIHDARGVLLAPDALLNLAPAGDYYIGFEASAYGPYGAYTATVHELDDDYTANNAAPGQLTVGGQLSGAIQYHGDIDRVKVTLAAGSTYKITLSNNAPDRTDELTLALSDAGGTVLPVDHFGAAAGTQTFLLVAPTSGSYTLDVSDYATTRGAYTIAATAVTDDYGNTIATAAPQTLDKVVGGTLQNPGDKDVFSFDLVAGSTYKASLVAALAGVGAARWTLSDSKGVVVGPSSTQDQSFTVKTTGKYYLEVSNPSTNTATYDNWSRGYAVKMSVVTDDFSASSATTGKLAIGATVVGKLEAGGGDSDWFAVTLDAGVAYAFSLKGTLKGLNGQSGEAPIRLLDASGKQLAIVDHPVGSDTANPPLYYTATTKGTYYIDVGLGTSGLAGDYTLQALAVAADDFGNDNAHAAKLADGIVANGKLQTAIDKDVFKISLADGALVTIDFGAPSGAAVKMTVTDSGGQEIKGALHHGDTSNGIYLDSAQYQAGAAGDYYVTVAAANMQLPSTAYSVKATIAGEDDFAGDDSTAGVLAAAKPQRGMIGVAGDADWFKVHLEAGHSYSFALQSGGTLATTNFGKAGGPGIDLYAADGSRVTTTLNTADVGVSVAGIATGDYFVGVHGNAYQTGSYTVLETAKATVTPGDDYGDARETATALVLGKGVSGVLATTNDIDMFKVDLVAGTTYTFDGALNNSPSSSVQLSLLTSDGSPVYATDGAAVSYSYTPAASGTYYMAVTDSTKFMTGASYTLKASPTLDDYSATAATAGKLVVGPTSSGTVSGKLDAGGGDRDWFAIALDKDGQYTFTLDGATGHEGKNTDEQGGATLRLLDVSGKVLAEVLAGGGSGALAYVPDAKGSYFLEVAGGDGHATGAYKLSVVNDADDYAGNVSTKGVLAAAAPVQGVVAGPGDQDWFKVHLDGGKTYVFDMKGVKGHGGTLDTGSAGTGLFLFDPTDKTQLAVADGPSDATGETQMVYKAQATGDFFLSAYGVDKGSYTLAESLGSADTKAPQLIASSLADGATGVGLGSKILLSFDDAIAAGSGIRLTDEHGATLSSAIITVSGNTLKIDPHQNLTPGAKYTLSLPEGSVLDLSGNRYAGHASYTFITVAPASSSTAGNGNDVFSASGTGQKIDGGAGTDTVFYDDTKVPLEIYAHDGQVTVYQTGAGTADTLTGIERLVFPTHAMAFDVDGNGGQAYRLYQAAFNRKPGEGLGFWMNALDVGSKLETVAQNFIDSPEFKTLYGDAPSNADFVTHLYSNVLHRTPLQAGYDFWLHGLEAGATRAQILINFSESAENHAALQPLIGQGFSYTPYG
jgi:hypothetical protein